MSGIKKFFQSIDLRNNKILNGKVETPTQNQHITNKEFVESQQKYDTTKAQTYNNPFKFDWITNVYNKTFKQILDDLFFPRVLPIFQNPEIKLLNFELLDYPNYDNNKYIIFDKQSITFTLVIQITNNDRLPLDLPLLKVYDNTSIQTYSPTLIIENTFYYQNISFIVNQNELQFKIVNNFAVSSSKNDSYGDAYLETGFELPYLLNFDLFDEINQYLIIKQSMMFRNQSIENYPDDWYSDIIDGEEIPDGFSFTKKIYFDSGVQGLFDVLIPNNFLPSNNYLLIAEIYDNSESIPKLLTQHILNDILIDNWDITLINDWYSDSDYKYYQLNFGYYSTDIMCVIKIKQINFGNVL